MIFNFFKFIIWSFFFSGSLFCVLLLLSFCSDSDASCWLFGKKRNLTLTCSLTMPGVKVGKISP